VAVAIASGALTAVRLIRALAHIGGLVAWSIGAGAGGGRAARSVARGRRPKSQGFTRAAKHQPSGSPIRRAITVETCAPVAPSEAWCRRPGSRRSRESARSRRQRSPVPGTTRWYQFGTDRSVRCFQDVASRGRMDDGDAAGRIYMCVTPAGGRAVAGSNPVSPTFGSAW
jgi:hypothetical protein